MTMPVNGLRQTTLERSLRLRLTTVALLVTLAATVVLKAQPAVSPPYQVRPLSKAPTVSYAAKGVKAGVAPSISQDPRVRRLADWLRINIVQAQTASGQAHQVGGAPNSLRNAPVQLQQAAGDSLAVRFRSENGTPMLIQGALQKRVKAGLAQAGLEEDPNERTARAFLREHRRLLRLEDPDLELKLVENARDEIGRRHLRFAQRYKSLPVWPCELFVHLDPQGDVDRVNGAYIPTPNNISFEVKVQADAAKALALKSFPDTTAARVSEAELVVHGPLDRPPRLAWMFQVHVSLTSAWRFIVDAQDGSVRARTSLVHEAAVTGSAADAKGVQRTLSLWQEGATYYMVDTSKPMFDPASPRPPASGRGTIEIYDAANKEVEDTQFSAGMIKSASANTGWDPDAVGAAYGLSQTYDYYLERFGRNSLNGLGGTIRALVRYGDNLQNAFWYGTTKTMVFGAGFTREIDISGHELTHGVLDSIGNGGILEYEFESGALNEALADIFGEMVEARNKNGRPDWLKADPFDPTDRDKLLQDYANPTSVSFAPGRPNPSKMSEIVQLTIDEDNGGVHINSSIINHCFYLLAEGLDGALGLRDAEIIFYRAMTTSLQKQSQFIDMRLGCVVAAEERFGRDSTQARKTREAFDRVEIFDAPDSPEPTPIPTVNAPDSVLFLRDSPLFGRIVLGRREAALGDGTLGTLLNTGDFVAPRRISVSGDGTLAVFVTVNNDLGILRTDGQGVAFADLTGTVHSVAMAPDANRFAVVLQDAFTGTPEDEIVLVDLRNDSEETVKLLAPVTDGTAEDIVLYADAMEFAPDGSTLIYDAVSAIPVTGGGSIQGWTLFAMDLATKKISTLINLDEGVDFGNPNLGNAHPYLLTHEVIDRSTGVSRIFAVDLRNSHIQFIATIGQAGVFGFPAYSGDDRAIIFTQVDRSVPTSVSLFRQALAEDGITPVGQAEPWLADADYAAIYRRGTFIASNAVPQVTIISPTSGQSFPLPAQVTLTANASDSDGSIAKVEFYAGSRLIGEDSSAPYSTSIRVDAEPPGLMRFTARAIDNLGGEADSAAVEIRLGATPVGGVRLQAEMIARGLVQLTIRGGKANDTFRIQSSFDLRTWTTLSTRVKTAEPEVFLDAQSGGLNTRFYRVAIGAN